MSAMSPAHRTEPAGDCSADSVYGRNSSGRVAVAAGTWRCSSTVTWLFTATATGTGKVG